MWPFFFLELLVFDFPESSATPPGQHDFPPAPFSPFSRFSGKNPPFLRNVQVSIPPPSISSFPLPQADGTIAIRFFLNEARPTAAPCRRISCPPPHGDFTEILCIPFSRPIPPLFFPFLSFSLPVVSFPMRRLSQGDSAPQISPPERNTLQKKPPKQIGILAFPFLGHTEIL